MRKLGRSPKGLFGLAAMVGVAFVMAAILLATPAHTGQKSVGAQTETPTATATANPDCELNVDKKDNASSVPEGGQITYTITVSNDGTDDECADLKVTDTIPTDTDCVSATVSDDGSSNLDFDIDGCDSSGVVTWDTSDELATDDEVVLTMVVELTSGAEEDDTISNTACAVSASDVGGDCDSERTSVGAPVTATPTVRPTNTAAPTVAAPTVAPVVPTPRPVATAAPVIGGPATGSGPDDGSSSWLAIALGVVGAVALLGGAGYAIRRRS
jgi:uncharacterized repeat protein (TIGR01451 family)